METEANQAVVKRVFVLGFGGRLAFRCWGLVGLPRSGWGLLLLLLLLGENPRKKWVVVARRGSRRGGLGDEDKLRELLW